MKLVGRCPKISENAQKKAEEVGVCVSIAVVDANGYLWTFGRLAKLGLVCV